MKFKPGTTLHDCLDQVHETLAAADLFYGHGTDNPLDEAHWLVDAVLRAEGRLPDEQPRPDPILSEASLACIADLLERRIRERQPLAYLLQEAWFAGLPFHVDERVLVPRSPIAELIENRFAPLLSADPGSILDLCTGSGCIGIACAQAFPEARVDLSDLSAAALDVARLNVARYQLEGRVQARRSDLLAALPQDYDLIVSNPPYVSEEEWRGLPEEYLHEPKLGLVTPDAGLAIPLRILQEAPAHLSAGGLLIMEVGYSWEALVERLPQVPFLWLEFARGGEGVCALSKAQLEAIDWNCMDSLAS